MMGSASERRRSVDSPLSILGFILLIRIWYTLGLIPCIDVLSLGFEKRLSPPDAFPGGDSSMDVDRIPGCPSFIQPKTG